VCALCYFVRRSSPAISVCKLSRVFLLCGVQNTHIISTSLHKTENIHRGTFDAAASNERDFNYTAADGVSTPTLAKNSLVTLAIIFEKNTICHKDQHNLRVRSFYIFQKSKFTILIWKNFIL